MPARPRRARGARTTTEAGYGHAHQAEREAWRPEVEAGHVTCWRCHTPIHPLALWDLGHDDHDRSITRGPEHRACNRAAAARAKNTMRHRPPRRMGSRDW